MTMISTLNAPKPTKIILEHLRHKDQNQIAIRFPYDKELIKAVKQLNGVTWSHSHKCWYVENNPKNLREVFKVFKGKAWVNSDAIFKQKISEKSSQPKRYAKPIVLSHSQKSALASFKAYMKGARYSNSAIENYTSVLIPFLDYFSSKSIDEISNKDIDGYNTHFVVKKNYSVSYQRQLISALKLFYKNRSQKELNLQQLTRPKKDKLLPKVLSEEEVIKMIQCTKNLKHRTIIALLYSSGLRISELINLRVEAIQFDRGMLHIRGAKGRKDRYVPLAQSILPLIGNYYSTYQPKEYLFEGQHGGKYTAGSARNVVKNAAKNAGIKMKVTPHMLRHSYATHLMENGIDTRYIQEFLGHQSIKTTMIYAHVQSNFKRKIMSPLDYAVEKMSEKNKVHTSDQNITLSPRDDK